MNTKNKKDRDEDSVFTDRPVVDVENKYFHENLTGNNFQHHIFKDVGAKKLTFTDVDFSYCVFERPYFHNCKFINCIFIGCRVVDGNFRGATFDGCKFDYTTFRTTLISHKEILSNLPGWPNVKRELLRGLRINAESVGDAEAVKDYVREELMASREHLKKAREGKESYYAQKYKGFGKKAKVYWDSIWNFIDWHLWGHGEYPHKLVMTVFLAMLIITGCLLYQDPILNGNTTSLEILKLSFEKFLNVVYTFFGVRSVSVPDGWAAFLALMRYVALGLFITVLYKRLSRR